MLCNGIASAPDPNPVRIVITRWGLDSYLEHRASGLFNRATYKEVLRPDILLLRTLLMGSADQKFQNAKFWGPAIDRQGNMVANGYKMKWHNFGNGNVQFRLCVAVLSGDAYLCHAYIKTSEARDHLMAGSLKDKIKLLQAGTFDIRGEL